jgi:hypothetical protein
MLVEQMVILCNVPVVEIGDTKIKKDIKKE